MCNKNGSKKQKKKIGNEQKQESLNIYNNPTAAAMFSYCLDGFVER